MKRNFKIFAVAIAAIMTIGSVTLVSCDKDDATTTTTGTTTTNTVALSGTKWVCHYERTQELYGTTVVFTTDYTLTFTDSGAGIYTADVSSTAQDDVQRTEVPFTYTVGSTGSGSINYQVPADMPDYMRTYFAAEQPFSVSGQTLTFIGNGENLVFNQQ